LLSSASDIPATFSSQQIITVHQFQFFISRLTLNRAILVVYCLFVHTVVVYTTAALMSLSVHFGRGTAHKENNPGDPVT